MSSYFTSSIEANLDETVAERRMLQHASQLPHNPPRPSTVPGPGGLGDARNVQSVELTSAMPIMTQFETRKYDPQRGQTERDPHDWHAAASRGAQTSEGRRTGMPSVLEMAPNSTLLDKYEKAVKRAKEDRQEQRNHQDDAAANLDSLWEWE